MAALFPLGRMVATPGAIEALSEIGGDWSMDAALYLHRHESGDWGDFDAFDRRQNDDQALKHGDRILSAYDSPARVWIITEGTDDRGARRSTCILLPEEY
jgi:hypothetical protein